MISRSRTQVAANGRAYGGVAFIYRKTRGAFEEFQINNPANYEVLATVGRIKGIRNKFFLLTCYAPPNMGSLAANGLIEFLSDLVAEAKRVLENPFIVVAEAKRVLENPFIVVSGDFNQWPIQDVIEEHPDLREADHGPTRQGRSIDRSFINFRRAVKASGTSAPLETEEGVPSDHSVAFLEAAFPKKSEKKTTYSYRAFTPKGAELFGQRLADVDLNTVCECNTPDGSAESFQTIMDQLMSDCFVWRTTTRKQSEDPWIDDYLRKLWKRRRKVYDRDGRSPLWRVLTRKASKRYRKRMSKFLELQRKNLTSGQSARKFHKLVKAYSSREKPPDFDIRDIYPGKQNQDIAEELANHFNRISSEFEGLDSSKLPPLDNVQLPVLTHSEVSKRLRDFKKPRGGVKGDSFPTLATKHADSLSRPLTHIYNLISTSGNWPKEWKTEFVTPIPKTSLPQSADDLRNISCTMLFSKVYETFVLNWLSAQIGLKFNQYGGVKGCGTEHLLVRLWQDALEAIEDPRAAVLLTSIDFSKAFNRLDFNHCLATLKDKGACPAILRVVASSCRIGR